MVQSSSPTDGLESSSTPLLASTKGTHISLSKSSSSPSLTGGTISSSSATTTPTAGSGPPGAVTDEKMVGLLQRERDFYARRNIELQNFIKMTALHILQQERDLVKMTLHDEGQEVLDSDLAILEGRIHSYTIELEEVMPTTMSPSSSSLSHTAKSTMNTSNSTEPSLLASCTHSQPTSFDTTPISQSSFRASLNNDLGTDKNSSSNHNNHIVPPNDRFSSLGSPTSSRRFLKRRNFRNSIRNLLSNNNNNNNNGTKHHKENGSLFIGGKGGGGGGNSSSNNGSFSLGKKPLSPERAVDFALKSLQGTIGYFENEREILVSKSQTAQKEKQEQEVLYNSSVSDSTMRVEMLQQEINNWKDKCRMQQEEMERIQEYKDQIESLEGERDALQAERQSYVDEIAFLSKQKDLWAQRRKDSYKSAFNSSSSSPSSSSADHSPMRGWAGGRFSTALSPIRGDDVESSFDVAIAAAADAAHERRNDNVNDDDDGREDALVLEEMQSWIEELKEEKERLMEQCAAQQTTINQLKQDTKIKRFDARFEERANDVQIAETRARRQELEMAHAALLFKQQNQEDQIRTLTNENQQKAQKIESLRQELEQLQTKSLSLEDAVAMISEKEADLKRQIRDLQDEKDLLQIKCKSQGDAFVVVQRDSTKKDQDLGIAMRDMVLRMEHLEDEKERLMAKCKSQEHSILILTEENERLQRNNRLISTVRIQ